MARIKVFDKSAQSWVYADKSFGKEGYTPVKGVDYWTPDEKKSIIQEILSEISVNDYANQIPAYVKTEADAVIERIIAAQGNRTFTFAAITDLHYGNSGYTDGIIHACQAMKYIDQRIKLDAVAVLGDYTDGYPASGLTNAFNDFMGINSILDELRFAPNLRQQGNHDYYKDNFPVTHRFIQAYSNDVVWGNKTGGYYYKDFDDYKLRVISLNTVEEANDNLDCSAEQYQWFADSLDMSNKEDADDWQILILSHHPIDWYTNDTGSNYWYRLPRIVKGYMNGLSSESYGANFTPTFDFSKGNNRASIICNIHGHIHNLLMAPIYYDTGNTAAGNVGVYRLATPNACYNRENQYDGIWKETQSYPKTQDTAKDTAFVVYCIDLDEMKINAICYGAGYDRVYSYSNKHTIQYHLTNVSSSNNITTIKNGYTYSTTLTPAGTNMDSITVLMDGVDVTESVYSNGSITISSVTGDVVIMAASIVNLLDTVGYTNDMRFSAASGTEKTDAGCFATGYIDISDLYWDDQYYIWGAELNNTTASLSGKCVIVTYDENKTIMGYSYINHDAPLSNIKCQFTDNGALYIIRNGTPIPHYIRISGIGSGANVVVTKNQLPITDAGYTNLLLEAIDTDKTPYNGGQYYKSNYRLNSTGVETAQSDMCVTGFIPVNYYDTIYLMNIDMKPRQGAVGYNHCYVYLYDENFNRITPGGYITGNNNVFPLASTSLTFDSDGNVTMFKIATSLVFTSLENKTDIRYMRISAQNITSDSIIIKNK